MSELRVFAEGDPLRPILITEDAARIAAELAPLGVRFERWPLDAVRDADAPAEDILAAMRPQLDALMGASGAGSADVIRMRGAGEGYAAMRQKFLDEHTHSEDEVRFFVAGSGIFTLHIAGHVYAARCDAGDLISVPAGIKHWFDAGDAPHFTVLRVFTDTTGWTPHYTGDDIAARFAAAA